MFGEIKFEIPLKIRVNSKYCTRHVFAIYSHFQGHFKFDFGPCVLDRASLGLVNIVELNLLDSI